LLGKRIGSADRLYYAGFIIDRAERPRRRIGRPLYASMPRGDRIAGGESHAEKDLTVLQRVPNNIKGCA
jgi:hypothetical protein